jgi:transketolase
MRNADSPYGTTRERGPTVSYGEIERAARQQMTQGERPTVEGVRKILGRGSPNHIAASMQRFWKDQAALNAGDPVALTRLPPELAESAQGLWEQALRLAQQTAQYDDSAARAKLGELSRDTETRARSLELREKEWDMAARIRERALADTREQVNVLLKELATATAELRANKSQIAGLESQIEDYRRRLSIVIARAVAGNRAFTAKPPKAKAKSKQRKMREKRLASKPARRRRKR